MNPIDRRDIPEEIVLEIGRIIDFQYPDQGDTSDVVVAHTPSAKIVIKRSVGPQFSEWLEQEYLSLLMLKDCVPSVSVPQALSFLKREWESVAESWLAMTYIPGHALGDTLEKLTDSGEKHEWFFRLGQTTKQIHSTGLPPSYSIPDNSETWLNEMLDRAEFNLNHFPTEGTSQLLEHLKRDQPHPLPTKLIHGDFHVWNVHVEGNHISGVIDWNRGGWGDPRIDLTFALQPDPDIALTDEDRSAFYEGYGSAPLSFEEESYYLNLYEFF